jgi:hypothetical protein
MTIPGYTHGSSALARSPITLDDLAQIKATLLFGDDDIAALRASLPVLEPHIEAILDVWYGFVGATPHLLASFSSPRTGAPDGAYLGAVRKRFGRWILDTARAQLDQAWLDYQHEIGLRHHRTKKNVTDGADAAANIPFRNLFALAFPITFTLKPFLAKGGADAATVERMYLAWVKSCLLQVTLWSHPYVKDGDF